MIKSLNPKRIVMAGGTMACALGIGYFMQLASNGGTPAAAEAPAVSSVAVTPLATPGTDLVEQTADAVASAQKASVTLEEHARSAAPDDGMAFEEITFVSAERVPPAAAPQPKELPDTPVHLAALSDEPISQPPSEESTPAFACDMEMDATPAAAALVELSLNAPCMTNTQFTLHHNGMMISAVTDADGQWKMSVPALATQSLFIAAFDNGEGAVANATVDNLEFYDRYVVQWKGRSGLQIHAMEYGATYGEDGHVWTDAARDMLTAANGEGGFIQRLGDGVEDTAMMAEVYTFPTQTALREGDVHVSLEAEVNAANCGRDIEAQVLVKSGQAALNARDLTLAMPDCDAVGDFLVLKNLYEDLKIARN
ncbi:MAG: hypothetical protein AAFW87_09825 [Pseudomonadota bacterium]